MSVRIGRRIYLLAMVLVIASLPLYGQGGGNLNPDLHTDPQAIQRFLDMRVGLSVHWDPSSQTGLEISWSRGKHGQYSTPHIPVKEYDQLYKTFNPVRFNADQWAGLTQRWGLRYMLPIAKHHDGFSMWFSRYSPYTMEQTPFHRDIMKELSDACRKRGIVFGAYYSDLDWYNPDWTPYEPQPGPLFPRYSDTPHLQRYLTYMQNQLLELVKNYHVQILEFDGEWPATWTHQIGSHMYRVVHQAQPDIILSSRIDKARSAPKHDQASANWNKNPYAGDYEEREQYVSSATTTQKVVGIWTNHPCQEWASIDRKQWSWDRHPDWQTPNDLIVNMVETVGENCNFLINVPPRPDGSFDSAEISIMDRIGDWLHKYGDSIYGTRGGPFYPAEWGVSTQKGNRVFLHLLNTKSATLVLPSLSQKIVSARLLATNKKVSYRETDKNISVTVPDRLWIQPDTVVELKFDSPPRTESK